MYTDGLFEEQMDIFSKCSYHFINQEDRESQILVLGASAGSGKEQPLYTKVQTPTGEVLFGSLRVGDWVIGADGKPTKVQKIHPQGIKPSYRITFRDGSSTECGLDHLWRVTNIGYRDWKTFTLKQLLDKGILNKSGDMKWKIPLTSPVNYSEKSFHIHPYLLGCLIGDGSISGKSPYFSYFIEDEHIFNKCSGVLPDGVIVGNNRLTSDNCRQVCFVSVDGSTRKNDNNLMKHLRTLGIDVRSAGKFIPREYLYGSIQQRIDLLHGLMDTDGSCTNNRTSFSSSSYCLVNDLKYLVQSLGGTAILYTNNRGEKGIEYRLNVKTMFNPFSLPRKANRWKPSWKNPPSRYIKSVEYVGDVEQMCITVEAEDSLYLTDEFIVTHNTHTISRMAKLLSAVGLNTVCSSITGRAVCQMKKVVGSGQTCHSLLYQPIFNLAGDLVGWERKSNEDILSHCADGIVIDESSMLPREIFNDLQQLGVPILLVGDFFQLPSIDPNNKDNPFNAMLDVKGTRLTLETIRRFKEESGIGWITNHLKKENSIPRRKMDDFQVAPRNSIINMKWMEKNVNNVDVFICGMNNTRKRINELVRRASGYNSDLPCVGERVVCLKNSGVSNKIINNGELFIVQGVIPGTKMSKFILTPCDNDTFDSITVDVDNLCWTEEKINSDLETTSGAKPIPFTFGYALTCHKCQGSTFENVVFIDEDVSFFLDRQRFRYTATSRAANNLIVAV